MRYSPLTRDPDKLPAATTRFVMTNLTGNLRHTLGNCYGLRTWIEYGFQHIKQELGWADYRLTAYQDIERWWELVSSAYLMVSLQTPVLALLNATLADQDNPSPVVQHPWWHSEGGWKPTLNNLPRLIQPFCAACLLLPWLSVFPLPDLIEPLHFLLSCMNGST